MKRIRSIAAVLCPTLLLVLLGCFTAPALALSSADKGEMRTVIDMAGNEVRVPEQIRKVIITSWGEPFGILISLGKLDIVAGMCDTSRYPWVRYAFPQVKDIPDYGSFDKINIEEILKADPDIIMAPYTAEKTNRKLRELGAPVYVTKVEDTDEYQIRELRALAELLGESARAEEILGYKKNLKDMVARRVADLKPEEKKRVYIMRRTILEKHSNEWSSGQAVELAGGINVAGDTDKGFETNLESLLSWDPEYIFQVIAVENNRAYYNKLKDNPLYANISAIKTGDTYTFPIGINYWYMGSEGGLGPLLIGKVLYPERFKDINIREEADKFYKKFLGITLDDESYKVMLRGFDGAKSLQGL